MTADRGYEQRSRELSVTREAPPRTGRASIPEAYHLKDPCSLGAFAIIAPTLLAYMSAAPGRRTLVKLLEEVVEASLRRRSATGHAAAGELESLEVVPLRVVEYFDLLFSSAAVDVASASLYLGGNYVGIAGLSLVTPGSLTVYPSTTSESLSGPPFVSSLRRLSAPAPGLTDRYVELGIPYEEDPYAEPGVLESDVRLALELYGIGAAVSSGARYVLIDGPLVPPQRLYHRPGYWADEVALLNAKRARYIREAASEGRVVVGFVKRVGTGTLEAELPHEVRPSAVGPVVSRGELDVCSFYLLTGSPGYSHVLGRVEIPCSTAESLGPSGLSDLLSMVYSSCSSLALSVPYGIYVADRVSKNLVKRLTGLVELVAKSRGILAVLPGELSHG